MREIPVLGVNIDHTATLRQARGGSDPEPLIAASLALLGGADGITVHLREDRRHINDRDLRLIKELAPPELNLEMAPTPEMIKIALLTKPDMATLVPEKREELTTEGGLDLSGRFRKVSEAVRKLQDAGIAVSLFIDPEEESVRRAARSGARMVEIHTGAYSNARDEGRRGAELKKTARAAALAREAGLLVNAGHGLNYLNVRPIACLAGLRGLYIGHSIISRAVFTGLSEAVRDMKRLIDEAVGGRSR